MLLLVVCCCLAAAAGCLLFVAGGVRWLLLLLVESVVFVVACCCWWCSSVFVIVDGEVRGSGISASAYHLSPVVQTAVCVTIAEFPCLGRLSRQEMLQMEDAVCMDRVQPTNHQLNKQSGRKS